MAADRRFARRCSRARARTASASRTRRRAFISGSIGPGPTSRAIVHTHPPAASALAAAEQPLIVAHMDATPLFDDIAFLPDWPGLPTADREGELIAGGLGGEARDAARPPRPARRRPLACRRPPSSPSSSSGWRASRSTPRKVGGAKPIDAGEARARATSCAPTGSWARPSTPGRAAPSGAGRPRRPARERA